MVGISFKASQYLILHHGDKKGTIVIVFIVPSLKKYTAIHIHIAQLNFPQWPSLHLHLFCIDLNKQASSFSQLHLLRISLLSLQDMRDFFTHNNN